MRKGDLGAAVAQLQRQLNARGAKLDVNAVFDEETEAAVMQWQRANGLVADGIAGRKTLAALVDGPDSKQLKESDLEQAAQRLGVSVAAIKAINLVESRGDGFLDDGRPVILYERHVAHRRLEEAGFDADALAARYPNLFNPKPGGYTGREGEWARVASASLALATLGPDAPLGIVDEACSWGQFQIMGYHWQALGYVSLAAFVAAMRESEAAQLDAFVRFIEGDPELHKALKAKRWPTVARLYNGPGYKANLYDVKLARAYDRFAGIEEVPA